MNLYRLFQERAPREDPVRFMLIGAGNFGSTDLVHEAMRVRETR